MSTRYKPHRIIDAVYRGDKKELSRLGRAGGVASAKSRERREEENTILEELSMETHLKSLEELMRETNEHIAPVDE